jgi:hypothetical protein|tara:strand:- start:3698 stop:3964 length:267 start_codon:yes stop_codon:yes gene_type:complete
LNDNSQQAKPYYVRDGFPLSPTRINDAFDAIIYDFYTMFGQDLADLSIDSDYYKVLVQLSKIEGLTKQPSNKEIEYIIKKHTSNWRHL